MFHSSWADNFHRLRRRKHETLRPLLDCVVGIGRLIHRCFYYVYFWVIISVAYCGLIIQLTHVYYGIVFTHACFHDCVRIKSILWSRRSHSPTLLLSL